MSFTSTSYYLFLIIVFFAFWLCKPAWRRALLLLASCFFYAQIGYQPLLVLLVIASTDFCLAHAIAHNPNPALRKFFLSFSLLLDVGTLCFFKYANFFLPTLKLESKITNLIVPLGLSFFIFQTIAYVVDVYRKTTQPTPNLLTHYAFLFYFPSLTAGPINRAKQLIPQFSSDSVLTAEQGGRALFLIAIGLIKKIAIADYLRTNFVDRVFDFPERFSSVEMLAAIYGYAMQIYADFSGYSDIAIGSALLLGITLPLNFNAPYRAQDLPEFWRRWHISLSFWLRDYVFFPLTNLKKRSVALLYFGLIFTMVIGGLWHGAAWTFVIWGLLHGLGLAMVRGWEAIRKKFSWKNNESVWMLVLSIFLTFHFVCATWIFFRAETFQQALAVFRSLANLTINTANLPLPILLLITLTFLAQWLPENWWNKLQCGFVWLPSPAQAILLAGLAMGLYLIASSDVVPFIYAKF